MTFFADLPCVETPRRPWTSALQPSQPPTRNLGRTVPITDEACTSLAAAFDLMASKSAHSRAEIREEEAKEGSSG